MSQATITNVPVSQIIPGNNDRQVFDQAELVELAESINENGLIQPITVRPIERDLLDNQVYEVVAGERRFRAISQLLKWETIPAIVKELSYRKARNVMLVENTGRKNLNPIEEADAYQSRIDEFGDSPEKIAKIAGVPVDRIKRRLSLRKLNEEIRPLVANNHFPIGHAEAITSLDSNRQRIAVRIYRESKNGLPLSVFRSIVSQLLEEQSQDSLFDLESFWVNQVQEMADLPRRGKRAITGAPTRNDLPPVRIGTRETQGAIIDRWIADLIKTDHIEEAKTVGVLYQAMVRTNYLACPPDSELLEINSDLKT